MRKWMLLSLILTIAAALTGCGKEEGYANRTGGSSFLGKFMPLQTAQRGAGGKRDGVRSLEYTNAQIAEIEQAVRKAGMAQVLLVGQKETIGKFRGVKADKNRIRLLYGYMEIIETTDPFERFAEPEQIVVSKVELAGGVQAEWINDVDGHPVHRYLRVARDGMYISIWDNKHLPNEQVEEIAASMFVQDVDAIGTNPPQPLPAVVDQPIHIAAAGGGELLLLPRSEVKAETLGAPSCMGEAEDLHLQGNYDVVYKLSDGTEQKLKSLDNLSLITPRQDHVESGRLAFADYDIVYFVPQYRDCHALELHMFAVKGASAFPLSFDWEDRQTDTFWASPAVQPQMDNGRLVINGGYGAGMDKVTVYTFTPDWNAQKMTLSATAEVDP
ncbi:hypothetical protein [Paenibacillus thalictri]|uniref:DUF4367 domain-containing protein n=1 Tax=Paenibacillus thalictri TaxID=2527873 RepID=A0A4Q9DFB0_9BACL|nr:hypothetical protein [Paenibacillus thalictri]TBL69296.1 hypothetical protein EYB31_36150 [Paenibacillus thalictri]